VKGVSGRLLIVGLLIAPAIFASIATARNSFSGKILIDDRTLPETAGAWSGPLEPITDTEKNVLHSPAATQRIYTNWETGDRIQVLLIQVENTQNAHDPRLCMSGSGFEETKSTVEPAPWADRHKRNEFSHSVFSKEGQDLHMYYWMSTSAGTIANMSSGLKLEGMLRAVRGEPTKGIAVRLLGLPNLYGRRASAEPEVLKKLWQEVRTTIKFDELVERQ
jgi:hypothetical protein